MTTAFITGIAGQDGTYLAERLAGEGCVVHGLVLDDGEAKVALSHAPGAVVHRGDLGDPDSIAALVKEIGPDEVYNLGGISSVAFSWEQPVLTGRVTGLGAVGVFEAARRAQDASGRPIRVVQASSSEVFGVPDKAPQDESTPIRPVSPYGAAKAYAHLAAAAYRARGLFVATCVFYNHESPRRPTTFVTRKITAAAARIARDGGTLTLGDLTARRDWGWAPDYVDALVRAARHDEPDDFVVATGETHSVADFAAAAFARAGVADWRSHVLTDPELYRPADSTQLVGRADKARRVLGWAPTCSFDDLVARLVDADLAAL